MYRTHYISEAKKMVGTKVKLAGWVHDFRDLGKMKFVLLRDRTGIVQVLLKKGLVSDELLKSVSVNKEDVVCFEGECKESKMAPDGVEFIPTSFELLNKVDGKLPVDPTDAVPSELETRIDNRFIDLRRRKIAAIFQIKSIIANAFREKLLELGFVEIHPTCITGAATEGGTDVFELQYFERKAYLVQSPQLYKQLAVIGGQDRVFMAVPVFRAEKHNTTSHLNEIVQMDIEMGFADHKDAMHALEAVFIHIMKRVKEDGAAELKTLGVDITVPTSIQMYTYEDMVKKLNGAGFEMKVGEDFTKEAEKKLDEVLGQEIYFIYDWPTPVRAFYSMPKEGNETFCNAFDLIYKGLEISSGAQRIHKPEIIEKQLKARGLDPYNFQFYINAFRFGAPPHAGWSIGLERLTQKICGLDNIREAMLFPRDRMRLNP
jgi:aspartyl-tRNA synthetase